MPFLLRLVAIITWGIVTYIDPIFAGWVWVIISSFFIVLWLISLVWWWEMLVWWSSSIAHKLHIPPIVVGLTILAFGTSAPELFVNLIASAKWEAELLISNIVWSNISNLLFIWWSTALVAALPVKHTTIRKEIPLSLLATILLFIIMNDTFFWVGSSDIVSRIDGIVLLIMFIAFLGYVYGLIKSHQTDDVIVYQWPIMKTRKSVMFILLGMYSLYVWWDLIVNYASTLAEMFGVSKVLIWASIVAIGTSVPELVTSVIAATRKETDMAVWNIIWSNLFNILWIVGISSLVRPIPVDTILNIDILILFGATVLIRAVAYFDKDKKIERWPGLMFMLLYVWYITFLIRRG